MLISRARAMPAGTEVWQGKKQLVPLLEKEFPPKSSLLAFPCCPSLASLAGHPGVRFSTRSALLLRDGSRCPRKVSSQQLSTSGCSEVLLPPPTDWENTFGKLPILILTLPSNSRSRDLTGTSQPSNISTLFGRSQAFPAGILPGSLAWNSSAFAALPRAPGPHTALP